MEPQIAYAFPARYEKPRYLPIGIYLQDLEGVLKAVFDILGRTNIEQWYTRREKGRNIDLMLGSTAAGRYVFARMNPEISIVSEDQCLVSQIRFQYYGRSVILPKRIPEDMVGLDSTVHRMMHGLFYEGSSVSAAHGEQMRFPL